MTPDMFLGRNAISDFMNIARFEDSRNDADQMNLWQLRLELNILIRQLGYRKGSSSNARTDCMERKPI